MKLATYRDGSRDGQLVVVSRDLSSAHYASGIATRLQQVLDDWNFLSPQLQALSQTLNHGKARHAFPFDPAMCMAPLPRAFQWASGGAYLNHQVLLHQARGAQVPEHLQHAPWMTQRASDELHGPREPLLCADVDDGIDLEAGLAVITGDVALGTPPDAALEGIRLLMLASDLRLHRLTAAERAQSGSVFHGQPATAFSPVAVTPDELGDAWHGGRVHLNIEYLRNGKRVGLCDAGAEMSFHFGQLIAHACRTRPVRAGSLIGSGPVSNADAARGCACIAEKRALETLQSGVPRTGFLQFGDTVHIEMKGSDQHSVFGAIEQRVTPLHGAAAAHESAPASA